MFVLPDIHKALMMHAHELFEELHHPWVERPGHPQDPDCERCGIMRDFHWR